MGATNMHRAANFIGHPTVEQLISVTDAQEPVYCMLITESGATTAQGLRTDKLVIVVSQPDERGDVHYVRLPVGSVSFIGNTPFDSDHAERRERARQAYAVVRGWLSGFSSPVCEALIAMPTDYRLLEGWADFLGYNKGTKQYFLKTEEKEISQ
jgi:hypothetical protein